MAFEEHHIKDARAEAEAHFTKDELDAAALVLNAFEFHRLETFARAVDSSMGYYEARHKKIIKAMGDLDYDLNRLKP